jgi:NTP pyrophosphatase (non-canonical NTP hydrolase)
MSGLPTSPGWVRGLADLQAEVAAVLAVVRHPRAGALIALVEEVGEIARHVVDRELYGTVPPAADIAPLAGELADVLLAVLELASAYQVDLASAMAAKMTEVRARAPGWQTKYGPALASARTRWDAPSAAQASTTP